MGGYGDRRIGGWEDTGMGGHGNMCYGDGRTWGWEDIRMGDGDGGIIAGDRDGDRDEDCEDMAEVGVLSGEMGAAGILICDDCCSLYLHTSIASLYFL